MEWFIQLHRKMLEWEWYDDINTKTLFIHLLLKANWKDKNWRGIYIKRWELLTWRITLAAETWLSEQQIRTSLTKLKSTSEITIKPTSKYSIVKLLNYNEYQWDNQQDNQQATNKQPASNQQVTTTNKVNNNNKENNIIKSIDKEVSIATKVATLESYIKNDFSLEFISDIYNKYNLTKTDFQEECESFLLYWKEKSINWKKERREKEKTFDPKLRFRNWMKNNDKWSKTVIVNSEDDENKRKLEEIERKKRDLFNKF